MSTAKWPRPGTEVRVGDLEVGDRFRDIGEDETWTVKQEWGDTVLAETADGTRSSFDRDSVVEAA